MKLQAMLLSYNVPKNRCEISVVLKILYIKSCNEVLSKLPNALVLENGRCELRGKIRKTFTAIRIYNFCTNWVSERASMTADNLFML